MADGGEFDVVVVGTGLAMSVLAAALARSGKRVVHVDERDYYGGDWGTLPLRDFVQWARTQANSATQVFNYSVSVPAPFQLAPFRACYSPTCRRQPGVCFSPACTLAPWQATWNTVLKNDRRFQIDLSAKLFHSRGAMVTLLVASNVSRYVDFHVVEESLIYTGREFQLVPSSKEGLMVNTSISLRDKRVLSKFLQQTLNFIDGKCDGTGLAFRADGTFDELLSSLSFSVELKDYVMHAMAMVGPATPWRAGVLSTQKYLRSLGVYGSTAFLAASYGVGELPQAFCRMCAVYGGVYMLATTHTLLRESDETGEPGEGPTVRAGDDDTAGQKFESKSALPPAVQQPLHECTATAASSAVAAVAVDVVSASKPSTTADHPVRPLVGLRTAHGIHRAPIVVAPAPPHASLVAHRTVAILDGPSPRLTGRAGTPSEQATFAVLPPRTLPLVDGTTTTAAVSVVQLGPAAHACTDGHAVLHITFLAPRAATDANARLAAHVLRLFARIPGDPESSAGPDAPTALFVAHFAMPCTAADASPPAVANEPAGAEATSAAAPAVDTLVSASVPAAPAPTASLLSGLFFLCDAPGASLVTDDAVDRARSLFHRLCGPVEFLPSAPNPEDIMWTDETPAAEANAPAAAAAAAASPVVPVDPAPIPADATTPAELIATGTDLAAANAAEEIVASALASATATITATLDPASPVVSDARELPAAGAGSVGEERTEESTA